MMATLLASGSSLAELKAKEGTFDDVYQYVLSVDPPAWDLTALDDARRARGKTVFDDRCASCHGVHSGPGARYDDHVEPANDVGTDPTRALTFDANDAAYINASWFGAKAPMRATGGYLAPPLRGVWATAPYFHNGSVPDLASVLDSSRRPARWRRVGTEAEHYDADRVGWRVQEVGPTEGSTIEGRKVYDTSRPGLSNRGHTYGDALAADDRTDLLEYLRGL